MKKRNFYSVITEKIQEVLNPYIHTMDVSSHLFDHFISSATSDDYDGYFYVEEIVTLPNHNKAIKGCYAGDTGKTIFQITKDSIADVFFEGFIKSSKKRNYVIWFYKTKIEKSSTAENSRK